MELMLAVLAPILGLVFLLLTERMENGLQDDPRGDDGGRSRSGHRDLAADTPPAGG